MTVASPFVIFVSLLMVLPKIQAISFPDNGTVPLQGCQIPCMTEVNLHLFLHQFVDGPNQPNRNEETLLQTSFPFGFGTTIVHDWTLTETTNSKDTVVARAQGVHVQAGLTKDNRWYMTHNIEFEQGRFAGSTLQVIGITAGLESGQWSIVGGTGQFIMAQGIISFTNHPASTWEDGIKELNIRVRCMIPQPDDVGVLEVLKPNDAVLVIMSGQTKTITNLRYKSVVHRAVVDADDSARLSVAIVL